MNAVWRVFGVLAVVAAVVATAEAMRVRSVREGDREAMRVGLEDVARRVRTTASNLATVMEINDRAAIAKARAFARLLAQDPSIVRDRRRFEALCAPLDVEELHVTDEKGIIIQTTIDSSYRFDMNSAEQPRPFMAAITNKAFELVQEPSVKPTDGKLFQYAGVARIDSPGIVQVGHSAERVAEARKLADVQSIATSTRVGRRGRVEIVRRAEDDVDARRVFRTAVIDGRRTCVLAAPVGDYKVTILMPVAGTWLSDDVPFRTLCVIDLLLLLGMALMRIGAVKDALSRQFGSLRVLFGGLPAQTNPASGVRRRWMNPMVIACALAFVGAAAVCWVFFSHAARTAAEQDLKKAAEDMRRQFDTCVDQQLFYQGSSLCKTFVRPEMLTADKVRAVVERLDLDELNVIDSRGIIIASSIPALVGYRMDDKPQSAAFNRLLGEVTTYGQPFRAAVEDHTRRCKYVGVAFPPPAKGYLQIGFSELRLKDQMDYWFADVANDWHFSKTGFFVVAKSETGEVDSCGMLDSAGGEVMKRGDTLAGVGFDVSAAPSDPDTFFEATLYGEQCLCLTEERSYHRIISAIPLREIDGGTMRTVLTTIAVLFVVFVLVAVFMTRLSELVASLKIYIAEDARRVEKDMAMAKAIQTNVLPTSFPPFPDLQDRIDIYARMIAAREVGGDFYDFFLIGQDRLALVIADVSGKGVPAALFMMRAKATLQDSVKGNPVLSEAVRQANDILSGSNDANMFVTAWIGVVDLQTGAVEYVNAGHNPPLVKRADGTVSYLKEKSGLPLATVGGVAYRQRTMSLGVGDGIILYTDGVTEAVNPAHEQYGEARLLDTVKGLLGCPDAQTVLARLKDSVWSFADGAEQADDITLLGFKRI